MIHFTINTLIFTNEMKSNFYSKMKPKKPTTTEKRVVWFGCLFFLSVLNWLQNCLFVCLGKCVCVRAFILKMQMCVWGEWKNCWDCVFYLSFMFRFALFSPTDHFKYWNFFYEYSPCLIFIMGVCICVYVYIYLFILV